MGKEDSAEQQQKDYEERVKNMGEQAKDAAEKDNRNGQ